MPRSPYEYPEQPVPVQLTVLTKCPRKWLLVDRETGQAYEGNEDGYWDKLVPKEGTPLKSVTLGE